MNPLLQAFGRVPAILPVVHVGEPLLAAAETEALSVSGAQGVFLIPHGCSLDALRVAYLTARERLKAQGLGDFWLGVNFLDRSPLTSLERLREGDFPGVDGLWVDNASIEEREGHPSSFLAEEVQRGLRALEQERGRLCYFGGVAFKGQRPVATPDLPRVGELAAELLDVATTSGPATGQPPECSKLRKLREGMRGGGCLAVASGATPQNVQALLYAGAEAILVATGISLDGDPFRHDPLKLKALLAAAKPLRPRWEETQAGWIA